jgi:hypothetical protein
MCLQWPQAQDFEHLDLGTLAARGLPHGWSTKGLLTAAVLAFSKGADTIDCYGVDWTGDQDFDGMTFPGQKRTASRWEGEARQLARLKQALSRLNITLTRILTIDSPSITTATPSLPV